MNRITVLDQERNLKQRTKEATDLIDYQKQIEKLYVDLADTLDKPVEKRMVRSRLYAIQRKKFEA